MDETEVKDYLAEVGIHPLNTAESVLDNQSGLYVIPRSIEGNFAHYPRKPNVVRLETILDATYFHTLSADSDGSVLVDGEIYFYVVERDKSIIPVFRKDHKRRHYNVLFENMYELNDNLFVPRIDGT